jgi:hypothetical protein
LQRNFFTIVELDRLYSTISAQKRRRICGCGCCHAPENTLTFRTRVRIIAQVLQYRSLSRQVEKLLISTFFVLGDLTFVLVLRCERVEVMFFDETSRRRSKGRRLRERSSISPQSDYHLLLLYQAGPTLSGRKAKPWTG